MIYGIRESIKIPWKYLFPEIKIPNVFLSENDWKYCSSRQIICQTRMHPSRMRTIRCSGRLGVSALGGVWPGVGCLSREYLPRGVSAWGCSPVDKILDTRSHYLSATTVADGNRAPFGLAPLSGCHAY